MTDQITWGFWMPSGEFVQWEQYSNDFCEEDRRYHEHANRNRKTEPIQ